MRIYGINHPVIPAISGGDFFLQRLAAKPRRHKVAIVALDGGAVLGPQDLIDCIREVGGLLRKYPAAAPLAAFVLLQLAIVILHHGIVHADKGVTAAGAVDAEQGHLRIVLLQDAVDEHVFV